MADPQSTFSTLAPGIYADQHSIKARVRKPGGGHVNKRFPHGTPLSVLQRWRQEMKAALRVTHRDGAIVRPRFAQIVQRHRVRVGRLPVGLDGWCYLYVIEAGGVVKIGRAINPHERLRALQTSHPGELRLLVAVPIHASLESFIHARFAQHRQSGEWFTFTGEVARFVAWLQAEKNPVVFVWNDRAEEVPPVAETG